MYRKLLVPWDGSALSETALATALPIARRHQAAVQIVHVHERPPLLGLAPMYDTRLDAEQRNLVRSEHRLSFASESPFATGNSFDLIVLAPRERTPMNRLLLGSVTDKVLRGAEIPVLLLHRAPGAVL